MVVEVITHSSALVFNVRKMRVNGLSEYLSLTPENLEALMKARTNNKFEFDKLYSLVDFIDGEINLF
jgi:hypothetical protein